jgi:hypothetical protein
MISGILGIDITADTTLEEIDDATALADRANRFMTQHVVSARKPCWRRPKLA